MFTAFNEYDCDENAKMPQIVMQAVCFICISLHMVAEESCSSPTGHDACCSGIVVSSYLKRKPHTVKSLFLAVLVGVKFTYVPSTTRCIYTCPAASGMSLKPPPEGVCNRIAIHLEYICAPGLFVIG